MFCLNNQSGTKSEMSPTKLILIVEERIVERPTCFGLDTQQNPLKLEKQSNAPVQHSLLYY